MPFEERRGARRPEHPSLPLKHGPRRGRIEKIRIHVHGHARTARQQAAAHGDQLIAQGQEHAAVDGAEAVAVGILNAHGGEGPVVLHLAPEAADKMDEG